MSRCPLMSTTSVVDFTLLLRHFVKTDEILVSVRCVLKRSLAWCLSRGLLPELAKHSFHAVWNSADLHGNPETLHNYANGPDGSVMSGFLFDMFPAQGACREDRRKPMHA